MRNASLLKNGNTVTLIIAFSGPGQAERRWLIEGRQTGSGEFPSWDAVQETENRDGRGFGERLREASGAQENKS